jgi:hypothetical protein
MLGHDDAYAGNVTPFQGQVIFDNLSVTQLALNITNITVTGSTVNIGFVWSLDEAASVFALQSSPTVTNAFSDVAATITRTGVGTYNASIATNGLNQFYQVRHK